MNSGEIINREKKKGQRSLMAFLLGLLSANNIVYAFVVGTTPILVICVYAVICLAWLMLTNSFRVSRALSAVPVSLWLFVACTFLSVIWVVIFHEDYIYQWFVGMISLVMYGATILLVVALKDYCSSIIKGIFVGIVINAVLVIYAFLQFRSGVMYTLTETFPAWDMPVQLPYNSFRGWGLFLEPGHLMRYVAIMALVVYTGISKEKKLMRVILIFSVAVVMVFTISSAIAVFLIGLIMFFMLSGRVNFMKGLSSFGVVLLLFLGLFIFSKVNHVGAEIWNFFISGLFDLEGSSESSVVRLSGMKNAVEVIKEYLVVGCGWNVFTKVFQEAGYYVNDVKGSYSELLSLIAELGIGAFTYIAFVFSNIKYNISKRDFSYVAMGCAIMIYFALFTMTDYSINGDCSVFIGLIIVYRIQAREQKTQA